MYASVPTMSLPVLGVALAQRRDAEVEHLHPPVHDHHVPGLEIAVDDAAAVQVGERLERLREQVELAVERAARAPRVMMVSAPSSSSMVK